jgi:hypothetical protein
MPRRRSTEALETPTTGRVAITLGAPFVVWLVFTTNTPFEIYGERLTSPFSMGLTPVVAAFVLVELVAAVVPKWRPLRISGPVQRAQLSRAAWILAGFLMAWELLRIALALTGSLLYVTVPVLGLLAMNVGWTLALVFLARMVGRMGLVNGYALLLTFEWVPHQALAESPQGTVATLMAFSGLVVVAAALMEMRWPRAFNTELVLRAPLSGLTPMLVAGALLSLPFTPNVLAQYLSLDGLGELYPGSPAAIVASVLLVAVLTLAFSILFCRPARVVRMVADVDITGVRVHFLSALHHSLLFTLGLTLGTQLLEAWVYLPLAATAPAAACVAALFLDARDEYRAREKLGPLVTAWEEQRVYALAPLSMALARADIPHHVRAARLRTLLPYVPLVPAELLVPPTHATAARDVLTARNARSVTDAQSHAPTTF